MTILNHSTPQKPLILSHFSAYQSLIGFIVGNHITSIFDTVHNPTKPYFSRFLRFALCHIYPLFYIETKEIGTKLEQNWNRNYSAVFKYSSTTIKNVFAFCSCCSVPVCLPDRNHHRIPPSLNKCVNISHR